MTEDEISKALDRFTRLALPQSDPVSAQDLIDLVNATKILFRTLAESQKD